MLNPFKGLIGSFRVIKMALGDNGFEQGPGELALLQVVTPVLSQAPVSQGQIVGRNRHGKMMGHMNINVMAKDLDPPGVGTVDCASQLSLRRLPGLAGPKLNLRSGVMHQCKGAHPKVIHQPGQQPEFNHAPETGSQEQDRKENGCKESNGGDRSFYLALMPLGKLREIKM